MHNAAPHNLSTDTQFPSSGCRSPGPTPQVCILSMISYGMEYSFDMSGSAVLAVSTPSFLCITSHLAEKSLCWYKLYLTTTKTLVGYQHSYTISKP